MTVAQSTYMNRHRAACSAKGAEPSLLELAKIQPWYSNPSGTPQKHFSPIFLLTKVRRSVYSSAAVVLTRHKTSLLIFLSGFRVGIHLLSRALRKQTAPRGIVHGQPFLEAAHFRHPFVTPARQAGRQAGSLLQLGGTTTYKNKKIK